MVNPSSSRSKVRKWGKTIKFWKHQRAGMSTDDLDRSSLITDEDDDDSLAIGSSINSRYGSTQSSAGWPTKESVESSPAMKTSWSFQEAIASVVQSIGEVTEDAKLLADDAQQAIADVVKSFDYGSEDEGKDSLAGEIHHRGGMEGDHISVPMGHISTTEAPYALTRHESSANESVDEIARAVQTANRAIVFSQSKTIGQGTNANKSVTSSRSGHNSRASRKSGLVSKDSFRSTSHSSQTTEDLSPSVQLLTEFSQADDVDEQDRQSLAPGHGGEIRSSGSGSLRSFLVGRKKGEEILDSDKKSKAKVIGGKRATGVDRSSKHRDSSSTALSSVTQEAHHPEIVTREEGDAPSSSKPKETMLRQNVRREAIVRELLDGENTSRSFDETYDGTLETYDGTLDTYDYTFATNTVETPGGGEGSQNAACQLMEQFSSLFCCVGLCGQRKLADTRLGVSNVEDIPATYQSCCGTTRIFSAQADEAPEDADGQKIEDYDDGTYNGTLENATCDGTYDNGTYDGTSDGTYDANTSFTENGSIDSGTLECDSYGTYDGTYDGTLETATDSDTLNDTVNAEGYGYEESIHSPGGQPNISGSCRSDISEVSSMADQSHIYMMMTKSRREKSEPTQNISKKPRDIKAGEGNFRRAASAFNSFKFHGPNTGDRKTSSKHLGRGILARIQVSPTSWSEPYLVDEPTTTNPNPSSVQKEWLRVIREYIHKHGDDSSNMSRYARDTLKRRAAAEEALQRIRRDATRRNKFAQ